MLRDVRSVRISRRSLSHAAPTLSCMALKRVYLDQRDWITLARQYYGRTDDKEIADVLAFVREASSAGIVSFPLSSVHYEETWRQRDPGRRQRLGAFMAEISHFHTIADAPSLLEAEVHTSLCEMVGLKPTNRPRPFGLGVAHAFNTDKLSLFAAADAERHVIAQIGAEALFEFREAALLVGPPERLPANGIALPTRKFAQRQLDFERETAQKLQGWGHNSDRAHRLVLAQESQDIVELVNDEAAGSRIDMWSYISSRRTLTEFMLSLAAKGAICRLRMSAHEDPRFRWHIGDLNDMTALGTAAGYCDVVVAEKRWGSILRRHAAHLHAKVTSNLREMPELALV